MSRYPGRRWSSYVAEALMLVVLVTYGGRLAWTALSPLVPYAVSGLVLIGAWRLLTRY